VERVQVALAQWASSKFALISLASMRPSWSRLQGLAWKGYVTKYVTKSRVCSSGVFAASASLCDEILQPIPRGLFCILPHHDGSNAQSTWLTSSLDLLSVFASGDLRGVLGSKAAIPLQYRVVGNYPSALRLPSWRRSSRGRELGLQGAALIISRSFPARICRCVNA
jgi:hypothetical protein